MKIPSRLAIVFAAVVGACSMNTSPPTFGTNDFEWVIAEGLTPEYKYQLRFCKFPGTFPRSQYPVRLNVFWSMARPRSDGLASPEDIERMHVFEERLIAATKKSQIGVLPMVLTGRGEREFVLYVRSSEEFMRALSQMPQEVERHPIEIHQADDPAWNYYDNEVHSVKQSSA
jgi:hypothetical protein